MSELFEKSIRTLELPRVLELLSDQADRGGGLNTRELLTIAGLLTAARRAREYFNDEAQEKTAIDHLFLSLHGNRFLEEKIKRCIPDEDTIADAASTELADIRRHMRAAQARSRQILQKIISSPTYGKILQEAIITGATVFVEPMGVVQANNEYVELEAKEQKEIDRILAELSADCAAHRESIQWDYDTLVHLDLIFARGQLSYKMDGVRPEIRRCAGPGTPCWTPRRRFPSTSSWGGPLTPW